MARSDSGVHAKFPDFVHDDLERLLVQLGGEATKTRLIAALIHHATLKTARDALRHYSDTLAHPNDV